MDTTPAIRHPLQSPSSPKPANWPFVAFQPEQLGRVSEFPPYPDKLSSCHLPYRWWSNSLCRLLTKKRGSYDFRLERNFLVRALPKNNHRTNPILELE
jgi:hypothetical protein